MVPILYPYSDYHWWPSVSFHMEKTRNSLQNGIILFFYIRICPNFVLRKVWEVIGGTEGPGGQGDPEGLEGPEEYVLIL